MLDLWMLDFWCIAAQVQCHPSALPPPCHTTYLLPPTCCRPTYLYHVLSIPLILVSIIQNILLLHISTLGPPVSIATRSPLAHLSILYHSLPLILVLSATKCPLAHPSILWNQYTINPSPYIIHTLAYLSALGIAHTLAHPSTMATIYPMGPCWMAPCGTWNCPLGWPIWYGLIHWMGLIRRSLPEYIMRCEQEMVACNPGMFPPLISHQSHTKPLLNDIQNWLPQGAALAPVIIATNKTQLTQFSSNKSAYSIYMTLWNIPRAIKHKPTQQACFLLGYFLVDKILKDDLTSREVSSRGQRLSMIHCISF